MFACVILLIFSLCLWRVTAKPDPDDPELLEKRVERVIANIYVALFGWAVVTLCVCMIPEGFVAWFGCTLVTLIYVFLGSVALSDLERQETGYL